MCISSLKSLHRCIYYSRVKHKRELTHSIQMTSFLPEPKITLYNSIFAPNVSRHISQLEFRCRKGFDSHCKPILRLSVIPSHLERLLRNEKKKCDHVRAGSHSVIRPKCSVYSQGNRKTTGAQRPQGWGWKSWGWSPLSYLSGLAPVGVFINKDLQSTNRNKALNWNW